MELAQKVDEAGSLTKEKDGLINQLDTKVQDLEEDKHHSEERCYKEISDMDLMKVDMKSLVAKFEIAENHALGEMQNLASERQIK